MQMYSASNLFILRLSGDLESCFYCQSELDCYSFYLFPSFSLGLLQKHKFFRHK